MHHITAADIGSNCHASRDAGANRLRTRKISGQRKNDYEHTTQRNRWSAASLGSATLPSGLGNAEQ
jgi:hypothetical protein